MKCLKRNKRSVYFCNYLNKEEIIDELGYRTGNYRVVYTDPIEIKAYVAPSTGDSKSEQFGSNLEYDKVLIIDDMDCTVDEDSVFFIDKEVEYDEQGEPLFDYIPRRIARSLNHLQISLIHANVGES